MEALIEIPGHAGYRVDPEGRVFSDKTAKFLKPNLRGDYLMVKLYDGSGHGHTRSVHLLVLEAFMGPRPEGQEACHRNGDSTDNRLVNLRWATPKENAADKRAHGTQPRGESAGTARLTAEQVRCIKASPLPQTVLASQFGVASSHICRIKSGKKWAHLERETSP